MKKTTILVTLTLLFTPLSTLAEQILSTWTGGGDGYSWGDPSNWNPSIIPNNNGDTFSVTIDTGSSFADIGLQEDRTINRLDCYGDFNLENWTPDWIRIVFTDPNGLTNHGNVEMEGRQQMDIVGNVRNTTNSNLEFWGTIDIENDLYNAIGATINIGGDDIGVGGSCENNGYIVIDPESEFVVESTLLNNGYVKIRGGQCESEIFDNNGIIEGIGFIYGENSLQNKGEIYASGGTLLVESEGSIVNMGVLANKALSTLNVQTSEEIRNFGTIEVNSGDGVAFDCNLVNDSSGRIELHAGTLAATIIVQTADANFMGFGGINGNVFIDPNATIQLTGPTNIVGDVEIGSNATLQVSDGITLITGNTTCNNGTIHMVGGRVICQGGLINNNCEVIWEPGLYINMADFNLDGKVNFEDFAYFANVWLWQASWY